MSTTWSCLPGIFIWLILEKLCNINNIVIISKFLDHLQWISSFSWQSIQQYMTSKTPKFGATSHRKMHPRNVNGMNNLHTLGTCNNTDFNNIIVTSSSILCYYIKVWELNFLPFTLVCVWCLLPFYLWVGGLGERIPKRLTQATDRRHQNCRLSTVSYHTRNAIYFHQRFTLMPTSTSTSIIKTITLNCGNPIVQNDSDSDNW